MNEENFELIKGSLSQRRRAANPEGPSEPTQQEVDELFVQRITPETDLPPMQPLFKMFDVPCFYRGELVANCGKAKSGKTFFLSIVMAACLTEKALALERHTENNKGHTDLSDYTDDNSPAERNEISEIKPLRVLWIDTEQSQQSTQEILRDRIIPLAESCPAEPMEHAMQNQISAISFISAGPEKPVGLEKSVKSERSVCDNFFAFNLRGLGFEKRGKMVDVAIRAIKPDIAVIDGIKDLMTDINDAVQATLIMEKLMALAKEMNCCIVCVLHQNKSEQDRNMRGSIGTELTNKAFEVFQCEVVDESNTFKVTHTYSRKQKMKRKLYYRVNDQGLPEQCANYLEQPRDDLGRWMSTKAVDAKGAEVDLLRLFTTAMEGRTQRPFGEVMAVALKKCGVLDAKTYYAYFAMAEEQGIVRKEVHPDNGTTWVELIDNSLPF